MADTPPAPSLFRNSPTTGKGQTATASPLDAPQPNSLLDCLYDGFYMIFLLRNHYTPTDAQTYRERIRSFLTNFERSTKRLKTSPEDIYLCKFAFCGLLDEVILSSKLSIRPEWERRPLQVEFFGEQLAGERFFDQLEKLRQTGAPALQVLEVFHMCLLMGFQGRYSLEGSEKLSYLTSRVGDDVAALRGKRASFAPHWQAPDRISHQLRTEVPLWVVGSAFALMGLLAFVGLRNVLAHQTQSSLAPYSEIIKLVPDTAHITITLP